MKKYQRKCGTEGLNINQGHDEDIDKPTLNKVQEAIHKIKITSLPE